VLSSGSGREAPVPGGEPAGRGVDRVLQATELRPADEVGERADGGVDRGVPPDVGPDHGGQHRIVAVCADSAVQP